MNRFDLLKSVGGFLLLTFFVAACHKVKSVKELYILPKDYTGPVIITYEDPAGIPLERDPEGVVVYRINSNGYLRISEALADPLVFESTYVYEGTDGKRVAIPHKSESQVSVFAEQLHSLGVVNGVTPSKPNSWRSFFVGRSGSSWYTQMDDHVRSVIGERAIGPTTGKKVGAGAR